MFALLSLIIINDAGEASGYSAADEYDVLVDQVSPGVVNCRPHALLSLARWHHNYQSPSNTPSIVLSRVTNTL